jgi:hypothetical protein
MKTSEKNFDEDCDLVRSTCLTEFRCDAATVVFVGGLKIRRGLKACASVQPSAVSGQLFWDEVLSTSVVD